MLVLWDQCRQRMQVRRAAVLMRVVLVGTRQWLSLQTPPTLPPCPCHRAQVIVVRWVQWRQLRRAVQAVTVLQWMATNMSRLRAQLIRVAVGTQRWESLASPVALPPRLSSRAQVMLVTWGHQSRSLVQGRRAPSLRAKVGPRLHCSGTL